jgi:DinB superfamily
MKPLRSVLFVALVLGCKASADTKTQSQGANAPSPVSEALRRTLDRSSKNLVAAAEEMPESKYGFKPTPAQMSFGDVIAHLDGGNDFLCSAVAGSPSPKRDELKASAGKEKLVARLRETFQYCDSALAKADDSKLTGMVPWFGNRQITRAQAVLETAQDWADHYSQLAIYLRLNGLLPPTAKQKE